MNALLLTLVGHGAHNLLIDAQASTIVDYNYANNQQKIWKESHDV